MIYEEVINKIVEIEKRYDVKKLKIDDVTIWPIIRNRICVGALGENKNFVNTSLIGKLSDVALKINSLLTNDGSGTADKDFFKENKNVDMLFLTKGLGGGECVGDTYFDKHIDPLIEIAKGKYSTVKLEIYEGEKITRPRVEKAFFLNLNLFLTFSAIRRKLIGILRRKRIEGFTNLKKIVNEVFPDVNLEEKSIVSYYGLIDDLEKFFVKKLEILSPKNVFCVCYYSTINLAIIGACKKLNIRTIDVQHGKQGKFSAQYTHWSNVPEIGYHYLPDLFWVWGEETQNNIMNIMDKQSPHKAIVGGNRWVGLWKEGFFDTAVEEKLKQHIDFDNYKKTLLVTLQPIEKCLPDNLKDAMKASPPDWLWLIRLHPVMGNRLDEIADEFKNVDANVEVDLATKLPLYYLLRHCDVHLTAWSTVCYEALSFGVPTIIFHKYGKDLYSDYVNKKHFIYCESDEQIISTANEVDKYFVKEEERPFIEMDSEKAIKAIKDIVG